MKTTRSMLTAVTMLSLFAMLHGAPASAGVVGVDVGDVASVYSGAGVLDTSVRVWENVADGTPTFTLDGDTISYSTTATLEFNRSATFTGTIDLFEDGEWGGTSGSQTATLSGLKTDGTVYNLALYSSQGDLDRGATFNIGGVARTATGVANSTTFTGGANYVVYAGVAPSAGGQISWTHSPAPGDAAFTYSGFEIESAQPGPSVIGYWDFDLANRKPTSRAAPPTDRRASTSASTATARWAIRWETPRRSASAAASLRTWSRCHRGWRPRSAPATSP